jgi:rhodanese-related sulfurtransferase
MKKVILNSIFAIAAIALMTSCNAIYENGEELAAAIRGNITEITVDELREKIDNGEEFLLIDTRQANEYDRGSIPGALNIPRGVLEFKIRDDAYWEEEFLYTPESNEEIIIYCKKGDRGTLAALSLQQLGFTNVKNLHGGVIAWDPEIDKNAPKKSGGGGCGD